MEVRKGYKQTEVGVIPEDWNAKKLSDLFRLQHGFSFSSQYFSDSGPIVLTPGNFKLEGGLYFNEGNTKRYSGEYRQSLAFSKGDLLIVMTDLTPDCNLLGKPAFVDVDEIILHNQRIGKIILLDRHTHLPFLYYLLLSKPYLSRLKETATGSTVRHTSSKSIYSVQIPLPPLAEQEAIAEALSDADALIESLETLFAKKRQVKQGAMSELLTGKRRLPGFEKKKGYKQTEVGTIPEDWEVIPMGSLGTFTKGMGIKKDEALSGEIPCVRYGEIYTHHNDVVREFNSWISPEVAKSSKRLKKGDLLFAGSGETKEEIGKCVAFTWDGEAYAGGDIVILTLKTGVTEFFGYLFNAPVIVKQKASKGQGDAVVHISSSALSTIRVPFPALAEQTAIAEIMSDMDAEIRAVEEKLSKARAVKTGMMSELLTGRTRLV